MFSFFKKLLVIKEKVKPYSTTLTTAKEGVSSLKELSPEINQILYKLRTEKTVDNDGLNKLASYYFNSPNIPVSFFVMRKAMLNGACLQINSVATVDEAGGDLKDLKIVLSDAVYGSDLTMTISVQLFHEFFQPFQPNFDLTKES